MTIIEKADKFTYILPGHIKATDNGENFLTILGSCVSVCLYDEKLKVGGITHYMLPGRGPQSENQGKYGSTAVPALIQRLASYGSQNKNMRAKIFGGAAVLKNFNGDKEHLGLKNVKIAKAILKAEGIMIIAEESGGQLGRKLFFFPATGDAFIRTIGRE